MTDKFVTARNTVSGRVGLVPAGYLTHAHFKNQYVLVEEGAKDYVPALYKPVTADEFIEVRGVITDSDEDPADDLVLDLDEDNEEN